jgi:hypothetical protein
MKTKLKKEINTSQNTSSGAFSKKMIIAGSIGIIPIAAMICYMKFKKQKEVYEKA